MADGAYQHVALDVTDIDAAYEKICSEGHEIITNGIEALPFWDNGVKFFMIKGPNEEKIEFCQKTLKTGGFRMKKTRLQS